MSYALLNGCLIAFAKSIDSGQPAQFAQADLSRNFSLFASSLYVMDKSTSYFSLGLKTLFLNTILCDGLLVSMDHVEALSPLFDHTQCITLTNHLRRLI